MNNNRHSDPMRDLAAEKRVLVREERAAEEREDLLRARGTISRRLQEIVKQRQPRGTRLNMVMQTDYAESEHRTTSRKSDLTRPRYVITSLFVLLAVFALVKVLP